MKVERHQVIKIIYVYGRVWNISWGLMKESFQVVVDVLVRAPFASSQCAGAPGFSALDVAFISDSKIELWNNYFTPATSDCL